MTTRNRGRLAALLLGLAPLQAHADPQHLPTPLAPALVPEVPAAAPATTPTPLPTPVPMHPALWKVSDADTTIYLFGTIHVLRPGLDWLNGPLAKAVDASDELVTEITDPTGTGTQAAVLSRAMLPDNTSLRMLMPPEKRGPYEALMTRIGLKPEALDRFKPWYASVVLSSLPLLRAGMDPHSGAEAALDARVTAAKHPHTGLETVDYQLGLFDSLPQDAQLALLDSVVTDYDTVAPQIDLLIGDWGRGDADGLATAMNADMDDPRLVETLLKGRNRNWAKWIEARLGRPGTVFVAVGAGHLAGSGSVQDQLAKAGIKVTRVQ
ncbi:TraB/GumN family protein [Novosphingobium lentum]|uniref:TraB/GumN family protein n=1 Tax=Novosphingobium lentum TaxID=145287 RepID=UPI000A80EA6A|nr:TraB/GumN family protein [Novosphingobium lentum]